MAEAHGSGAGSRAGGHVGKSLHGSARGAIVWSELGE